MSSDSEKESSRRKNGPKLRGREKRRYETADSEEEKEQVPLTRSQEERAHMIIERLKGVDRLQYYKDKLYRRGEQDQLLANINEHLIEQGAQAVPQTFMSDVLDKANDIFAKTELNADGKEMFRDSNVIAQLSNLLIKQTTVLMSDNIKKSYATDSFVAKLTKYSLDLTRKFRRGENTDGKNVLLNLKEGIDFMAAKEADGDTEPFSPNNWALLKRSLDFGVTILDIDYIKSCFEDENKMNNEERGPTEKRQKQKKAAIKDEKEDAVVINQQKEDENSNDQRTVSKELIHIHCHLRKAFKANGGKVNYYKFVLNPHSFGKSVENIFNTSFLIRDGAARMDIDATENMPFLYAMSEEELTRLTQMEKDGDTTAQWIQQFDHKIWTGFVKLLKISEPMIPPYTDSATASSRNK